MGIQKTPLKKKIFRSVAAALVLTLLIEQSGFAQSGMSVNIAGYLSAMSTGKTLEQYRLPHLRSLSVGDQLNRIQYSMDKGNCVVSAPALAVETKLSLKYFLAGVALDDSRFWVNLRPDSPKGIIDPLVAQTALGEVLCKADLQLKIDSAKAISPQTPVGKEYWDKLYKKAAEVYGNGDATIPTFTRLWIVPDEIIIRQTPESAYICKATLKVLLEQDHLKGVEGFAISSSREQEMNEYASQLIRKLVIPQLTREVNTAKRYSGLRQVYYSLILAQWFKQRFAGSRQGYAGMIDSHKISRLNSPASWDPDEYFEKYRASFKHGEFDLKEQVYTPFGRKIRTYFSGGVQFNPILPSGTVTGNSLQDGLGRVRVIRGAPDRQSVSREYLQDGQIDGTTDLTVSDNDVRAADLAVQEDVQPEAAPVKKKAGRSLLQKTLGSMFLWVTILWAFLSSPFHARAMDNAQPGSPVPPPTPGLNVSGVSSPDATYHELFRRVYYWEFDKRFSTLEQKVLFGYPLSTSELVSGKDRYESAMADAKGYPGERFRNIERAAAHGLALTWYQLGVQYESDPNHAYKKEARNAFEHFLAVAKAYPGDYHIDHRVAGARTHIAAISGELRDGRTHHAQKYAVLQTVSAEKVASVHTLVPAESLVPKIMPVQDVSQGAVTTATAGLAQPHNAGAPKNTSRQSSVSRVSQDMPQVRPQPALVYQQQEVSSVPIYRPDGEVGAFSSPSSLLPVDQAGANSKIVQMGNSHDAKYAGELRRILRQHDDKGWEGFSLGALLKFSYPLGVGNGSPSLNAEFTAGKILEFLNSGRVHILSLYDTQEPSDRAAAAWALGQLKPAMDQKTTFLGIGTTKRDVIKDLSNALLKDKDARVRAAAAWALGQYNNTRNLVVAGEDVDVRIKSLMQAINDKEWLVRYYVAQALASSADSRATQPIINLLEKEDNPYVLAQATEAALRLGSYGALQPIFGSVGKLAFDTAEDEMLYAVDSVVWNRIADNLSSFGAYSPQARQQVISGFIKALQYAQAERSTGNKYEVINYNLLPLFEQLAGRLGIQKAEIEGLLQGLDPRIAKALVRFVDTGARQQLAPLRSLQQVETQQRNNLNTYIKGNPAIAEEIHGLEQGTYRKALERIVIFDRGNTARRVLAADALSRIGNASTMRALVAGLRDSHPAVRAVCARALRDQVSRHQFVYTGQEGSLVKALTKAASDKDLAVAGYLLDTLRSIGDSDALQAANSVVESQKNPLLHEVFSESLTSFGNEGAALSQPVLSLLAGDTDTEVLVRAVEMAKGVLHSADDPVLVDGIINAVVRFPANPESYDNYSLFRQKAVDALGQSAYAATRLQVRIQEKLDRGDYPAVNLLRSLLQDLQMAGTAGAVVANEQGEAVSALIAGASNTAASEGARLQALGQLGRVFSGASDIRSTTQLIKLIETEPNSRIAQAALAVILQVNTNGDSLAYASGNHPLIDALAKVATDPTRPYEMRKQAVAAIGQVPRIEAARTLSKIIPLLQNVGLLLAASDASCAVLEGMDETGLTESLVTVMVDRLDVAADTVQAYPEVTRIYSRALRVLQQRQDQVLQVLVSKARDEVSTPNRTYHEDAIVNILHLASLLDHDAVEKVGEVVFGNDIHVFLGSDRSALTPELGKVMEEWMKSHGAGGDRQTQAGDFSAAFKIFGQLTDAFPASVRAQAIMQLRGYAIQYQLNSSLQHVVRDALKDPDQDVRIAATLVYATTNSRMIPHAPNTNVDVDALSYGLTDNSIDFHERLFRIIALGKTSSHDAVRPLLESYYALTKIYPFMERESSRREYERTTLSKAIEWGLGNMQQATSVSELRNKLNARINQGTLGYEDVVPLMILDKLNPGESQALAQKLNFTPVSRDPSDQLSRYHPGRYYFDIEREGLALQWQGFQSSLRPVQVGLSSRSTDSDIAKLVLDKNPEVRRAVAQALGQKKDVRSILALTAALHDENEFVAAQAAGALAQFESPLFEEDFRIPAFREVLEKGTSSLVRAEVAHALGSSGDPRAVELIQKVLAKGKSEPLVSVLAADSAGNLAVKFKNPALMRALLKIAKDDFRDDVLSRAGAGYKFGPAGQAAYDALLSIGTQDDLRPVLAGIVRDNIFEDLKGEARNIVVIHDVESDLLKKFSPEIYNSMWRTLAVVKTKYWVPVVATVVFGIGGIGFGFWFIFKRFIMKKPWFLRDFDKRRFPGKGSSLRSAPIRRGPAGSSGLSGPKPGMGGVPFDKEVFERMQERFRLSHPDRLSGFEAEVLLRGLMQLPDTREVVDVLMRVSMEDFQLVMQMATEDGGVFAGDQPLQGELGRISEKRKSSSIATASMYPVVNDASHKCKHLLRQWEGALNTGRLSVPAVSSIMQTNYLIINILPLSLEHISNDIHSRADIIHKTIELMDTTIPLIIKAIKETDDPNDAATLTRYAKECIEIERYFVDYSSALNYMVDLQISAGYERAEGGSSRARPWWHRMWGIEAIGDNGKENLAYLQEKLYLQGNALVPFMYTVPADTGDYRMWVDAYYQHLAESVTEDLGISAYWKSRKMFTRVMPLFFSIGIGGLALLLSLPGLVQNLTAIGLVLYFFKGFTSIFFGFIVSTSFSWYFIKKGWSREVELYSKLHGQIDDFEGALAEVAPQSVDETPEHLRKSMIVAQVQAVGAGFEAELDPGSSASADLILVGVGSDKQRADFIRQALVDKGLIRTDVPVFAFMNDNAGSGVEIGGSADAFSKAYSLIDPAKDMGGIIQSLSADATVACLNPDGAGPSASRLKKKAGQARIIVLYAGGSTLDWMSQPLPLRDLKFRGATLNTLQLALGNGYRAAQVLHSQGRGGVVNLHADGAFLGPLKDMQEGVSIVSSWTSQDQMNTQKLGLLLTEDERIRKYYDHFNPNKVGSWLEREVMAGRYQMNNAQKRQMTISSGILITSFTEEKNFARFCAMLKGVREYLIQSSHRRNFPTRIAPDLLVPMVMMSQQENIYTYLEAYLKQAMSYAGQVGGSYPDEKEARDFYLGLFKVIDRGYRNVYPGVFNVQIQYPHESVYSHGPAEDLAGLLRTYWGFDDNDLSAGSADMQPVDSGPTGWTPAPPAPLDVPPIFSAPEASGDGVGGIDFRGSVMPVQVKLSASLAPQDDTQWQQITGLVKGGIVPSGERLKEYLKDRRDNHDLSRRMENIRECIIDIFRIEENRDTRADQPFIGILELVENSSSPADDFLRSLAKIEVPVDLIDPEKSSQ